MEIWSNAELQNNGESKFEVSSQEKLQLLQHAFSERCHEITYLKNREDKMILWIASFFALTILGSLIFNSSQIHWIAKLFFIAITAILGWYGSEYVSQGRDDMQTIIALITEIRDEIAELSFGYSRELLPDPTRWEVASRWEMSPIDMFLKGSALVAIVTILFG